MKELLTPLSIWKDYNACVLPLDLTIFKEEKVNGVTLQHLYFNGRRIGNDTVRVYAVVGFVDKSNLGLVIVGQPQLAVSVDSVVFWARKGYTVVTVDYAGDLGLLGQGRHTVYPESISYANSLQSDRHATHVDESVVDTVWYEYAINTMRAVTLLSDEDYCGASASVVLFGEGRGNKTALHTLAADKRIKAGAILFGNLWEYEEEVIIDKSDIDNLQNEELSEKMEIADEQQRWLMGIAPQSYLQYITQPLYFITGTNSGKTDLGNNELALNRLVNSSCRSFIVPRMLETVTTKVAITLQKWYDEVLSGSKICDAPKLSFCNNKGILTVNVKSKSETLDLFYARGGNNTGRNWVYANVTRTDSGYTAELDIYDENIPVSVFANSYFDGMWISSDLVTVTPKAMGNNWKLMSPSKLLYSGSMGRAEFTPLQITERGVEYVDEHLICAKGHLNIAGVKGKHFGTFALGENKVIRNNESVLTFDVYSGNSQQMSVYIVQFWATSEQTVFKKTVNLLGGALWQKVMIEAKDFKSKQNDTLENVDGGLDVLCFEADSDVIVNNIFFT